MPINFPSSPSLNQTYTNNSVTWKWNGTVWNVVPNPTPIFTTVATTTVNTTNLTATTATVTGNVTASTAPTTDNHLTNKKYVDTKAIAFSIGLS